MGLDDDAAPPPLASLVAAARQGDRAAFGALHGRLAPMVHAVLVTRVPFGDVDDLLQEVFLSAWRGLDGLRDQEHVGAWLASIARRSAARFHARARPRGEALPDDVVDPAPGPDPDATRLLAELAALPRAYRDTLAMRLIDGLAGAEIAALTGLTPGSVRVNLHRGMALLRERLARLGWP